MSVSIKFDRLEKEFDTGERTVIIVEGKKDKKVLMKLGFKNIIDISGKSLDKIENIIKLNDPEAAIILADFDEEGERYTSLLTKSLESNGINVKSCVRRRFRTLFNITKIEELKFFTKFMEDDYYGKTCPINDKIFNRSRIHNRWNGGKTRRDWCHLRPD